MCGGPSGPGVPSGRPLALYWYCQGPTSGIARYSTRYSTLPVPTRYTPPPYPPGTHPATAPPLVHPCTALYYRCWRTNMAVSGWPKEILGVDNARCSAGTDNTPAEHAASCLLCSAPHCPTRAALTCIGPGLVNNLYLR